MTERASGSASRLVIVSSGIFARVLVLVFFKFLLIVVDDGSSSACHCYLGEGIVGGGEEGEGPLAGRHLGQVGRRQGRPQGREPWGLDLEIFFLTISNRSSVERRSAIVFVVGRG